MHADAFARAFTAAVRYAANEHGHETGPVGFPIRRSNGDVLHPDTPRHIAADALEDEGRSTEAHKLRTPGPIAQDTRPGHVGKVRRGVLHPDGLNGAIRAVEGHVDDWSMQGHRHPVIDYNGEEHGDAHGQTPGQLEAEGEPLEDGEVLVSHIEGQHDSDQPDDYGEWEHDRVPLDRLGDHVAGIIDDHVSRQRRNNWGEHHDEDHGLVNYDGNTLDDLADVMGWDLSPEAVRRLSYRDPMHVYGVWSRHSGEGYAHDAEETSRHLSSLAEDLQADMDERNGENRAETLSYPHLEGEDLQRAIELAQDAEKEFDELAKEPDRRVEHNENKYERLLKRLRDTKPVVPDPADNDE